MRSKKLNIEIYREAVEILRIGNRAVRMAQESNRERNIPNVYNLNGILYYELSNGELSLSDPYTKTTH